MEAAMSAVLQLNNQIEKDFLLRLTSYRMMPQLHRESIIDRAIASVSYAEEELLDAQTQFYAQNQLTDDTKNSRRNNLAIKS